LKSIELKSKKELKVKSYEHIINQGALLYKAFELYGGSQQSFAESLGITYQWLNKIFKKEKIPKKIINTFCLMFKVDKKYFHTGDLGLLSQMPMDIPTNTIMNLKSQIVELENKYLKCTEKVIELQDELLKLKLKAN